MGVVGKHGPKSSHIPIVLEMQVVLGLHWARNARVCQHPIPPPDGLLHGVADVLAAASARGLEGAVEHDVHWDAQRVAERVCVFYVYDAPRRRGNVVARAVRAVVAVEDVFQSRQQRLGVVQDERFNGRGSRG
eukprot:scaffold27550_cov32-Prasinocladus_malaysianus.AAC.1